LAGTTQGSRHGQLWVSGTLDVGAAPGYEPNSGDGFEIISFATRVGDFAADAFHSKGRSLTEGVGPISFTVKESSTSNPFDRRVGLPYRKGTRGIRSPGRNREGFATPVDQARPS
jgi:hypothetical protein